MSKQIPRVKTWKVTFYVDNKLQPGLTQYVDTINKDFARYLVRQAYWSLYARTNNDQVITTKVSLERKGI